MPNTFSRLLARRRSRTIIIVFAMNANFQAMAGVRPNAAAREAYLNRQECPLRARFVPDRNSIGVVLVSNPQDAPGFLFQKLIVGTGLSVEPA